MINLLLAEDEPPILRDIRLELEQYADRFCVAATAFNGKEALDYLSNPQNHIDVLITDIEMPVIGGLELIQTVHERYPSILCIILTGYSSFEYARKAITLGVCDYLLKPVEETALKALLDSIYHKICQEHLESTLYRPSKDSVLPVQDPLTYATCILCAGTFSPYSDYLSASPAVNWHSLNLDEMIRTHIPFMESYWIIDGKSDHEKNIIFTYRQEPGAGLSACRTQDLAQYFRRFFHALHHKLPYINAIVNFPVSSMNDIGSSIRKLRTELGSCFVLGRSRLFFSPAMAGAAAEKPDSLYEKLNSHREHLEGLFCQLDYPGFKRSFHAFLKVMEQNRCPENMVFQSLCGLTNSCCLKCGSALPRYLKNSISLINDIIVLSDSFDALAENMLSVYEDLFPLMAGTQDDVKSPSQLMLMLDSYIQLNYTGPINTQTLSQRFGFSPAYLSKLFREYKNISPAEYIINLRMEKARALFLASPSARIQDVAAQVGYEDALYFSKVFKKNTGFSPREFVRNCP